MKFAKGGLIIENNNPVCNSLYLKQGWVPFVEEGIPKTIEAVPVIDEPIKIKVIQTTEEVKIEQPDKTINEQTTLSLTAEKPTVKTKPQPKKSTSTKRK